MLMGYHFTIPGLRNHSEQDTVVLDEVIQATFDLPICDKCRADTVKINRIKETLFRKLEAQAKKGKKNFKTIHDRFVLKWSRTRPDGPPAPPPGTEMEIEMKEQ